MVSPFDSKSKAAAAIDRTGAQILMLLGCIGYFYILFHSLTESLIAGSALFLLFLLCFLLLEQRTLRRRDRLLRQRAGGMIALEELLLMPRPQAEEAIKDLLCRTLAAESLPKACMRYSGKTWLVCCAQCPQGKNASDGDVLAAHRARIEQGTDACVLASTGGFTPEAIRTAEWMDPPVRLISGRQLSMLFGRIHPATDEDIARHIARQRKPFSRQRIRALALSPAKLRRYLLCALLLLIMYLFSRSAAALIACLLSFALAILCERENRRSFRL